MRPSSDPFPHWLQSPANEANAFPMSDRPRIFSGTQPTGALHIGNYLGAIRQWAQLANSGDYDSIFCVVDAHAITVPYPIPEMQERIIDTAITFMACGLDPERCTIFVQSQVPQHMELAWYLSAVTPMGDLQRMTQFKEKSEQHRQSVNAGLFTYPVLMAADVLLYKATVVPVGDDQVQHLELAREISRKFNARFGDVFPEPSPKLSSVSRILGVDGKAKMSKTRGNAISIFEEPKAVSKKLKGAFTDPEKLRMGDPGHPERCNVFAMHKALAGGEKVDALAASCRSGELGCGGCKSELSELLNRELDPIRERGKELYANRATVLEILADGATRARRIADLTVAEVREAMGLTLKR